MKINTQLPTKGPTTPGPSDTKKEPTASPPQQRQTDLSPGQLIKGKILSITTDGTTNIAIYNKTITAKSLIPLTPGQDIWLQVLTTGDLPLLGTAAKKGAAIDLMIQLLGLSRPGASSSTTADLSLLTAKNLSDDSSLTSQTKQFLSRFQETLQGSQADIGKLLRAFSLMGMLENGQNNRDSLVSTTVNKELQTLIKIFEGHSQLNSQLTPQDQQNFLLFPCFFAGNCGWGEWMLNMENDAQNQEDAQRYGLTFFLEMSNLGEVYIKIQTIKDAIQGVFSVATKESLAFLKSNIPELNDILLKLGYNSVTLSTQLSTSSNIQRLKESLSQQTANPSFALLDRTI